MEAFTEEIDIYECLPTVVKDYYSVDYLWGLNEYLPQLPLWYQNRKINKYVSEVFW